MSRSISPPLVKRRRLNECDSTSTTGSTQPQSDLQVFSWNINGIQPFIQKPITSFFKASTPMNSLDKTSTSSARSSIEVPRPDVDSMSSTQSTASLRDFLRRHHFPTMLFLQEVKIAPSDIVTQRAVAAAVRAPSESSEPSYVAHFCLPTDKHNARGFGRKVYGVCTIVRSDFLSSQKATVRTVDWDLEGRFQIVETLPDQASAESIWPKLSIWNIYAVNGTDNSYKDPDTGQVIGTRHDRKLAVHALMLAECKRLQIEGYCVILAGDLNIARSVLDGFPSLRTFPEQHVRNRLDFNHKFFEDENGLRALDTFRHLHGDQKRYTYHPRGGPFGYSCDRVDLILCSGALEGNLVAAGMLDTSAERGPSDHCPLYASFAFQDDRKAKASRTSHSKG